MGIVEMLERTQGRASGWPTQLHHMSRENTNMMNCKILSVNDGRAGHARAKVVRVKHCMKFVKVYSWLLWIAKNVYPWTETLV